MSLKDLNLKAAYDSDEDDILNEFYIPALSKSVVYKRIAGFFTSTSFAIAAKGLAKFISCGGKIQLIANVVLSKEDYEKIKEVSERPFLEKAENDFITGLENIEDELIKNHVKMLGWMLKNKKLEIKISLVSEGTGIQHQKTGILEDEEGNIISFTGSDNETKRGWIDNIESFHVFRNWGIEEKEHIDSDINKFEKFWDDKAKRAKIYSISEAVKMNLIKIAPKNDKEFEKLSKEVTEELIEKYKEENGKNKTEKEMKLRDYQLEAIENWIKNDHKGIFEMATGTGKTFTAIGCLQNLLKKESKLITIIVCPYGHLIKQWEENINLCLSEKIVIADGSNVTWKDELSDLLIDLEIGRKKRFIILTTYNTFSSNSFINKFKDQKEDIFLIADEMHWSGAETFKEGLLKNYNYRLGLSATPSRYFDDEGSNFIINYFGNTVYTFDIKQAIKAGFLTPYEYHPIFVELNEEEFEKYEKISKRISQQYAISKNRKEREEILQRLLEKRQEIITNCSAKYESFESLLNILKNNLFYCLVYCSPQQIRNIQTILNKNNIVNHTFTGEESSKPSSEYAGKSQRSFILDKFGGKNPSYQVLLAMKILDEGVDIPSARTAIFLASSGNPRQYVQRRGRILRKSENKKRAIIYDILVVPSFKGKIIPETEELERKILKKELIRYDEFAKAAENYTESLNIIFPIKRKYQII